jgi:hypothetical protein
MSMNVLRARAPPGQGTAIAGSDCRRLSATAEAPRGAKFSIAEVLMAEHLLDLVISSGGRSDPPRKWMRKGSLAVTAGDAVSAMTLAKHARELTIRLVVQDAPGA